MKINKFIILIMLPLIFSFNSCNNKQEISKKFENFITVRGSKLYDGNKEFCFLSYNVPTLNYVEDNMEFDQTNPYGLPTEFELRDLFESIVQTGGNTIRTYTIPVRNNNFPKEAVTYVEAPGEFNEEAFKVLDLVMALANEYKVRVIIPFVNNWQWMGGRPNYADFRGKAPDDFWTDKQIRNDFKQTISYLINRTNTITGKKYKDDKAILCWETGNELENTEEWAIDIARYIKSLDQNHLLMDGFFAIHAEEGNPINKFIEQYAIDEPAFDIISSHHYEPNSVLMIKNMKKTVEMIGGKKPLIIDEWGFIGTSGSEAVLDYIIDEHNISGALLWSLRRHNKNGGFYHHTEPFGGGLYRAYHWPGFHQGEAYDEKDILKMYREKSFAIRNLEIPEIKTPKSPKLLSFNNTPKFSWQGSAGASGYNIERSMSINGPWKIIEHNIDDIDTPGFDLYNDESAKIGETYYYRVVALNEAGKSSPSNIVGPIEVNFLTRVDYAKNLMALESFKNLEIITGDYRSYKEAFSRIHGNKKSEGSYIIPGKFKELRLYSFESSNKPNIVLYVSEDGKAYKKVKFDVSEYKLVEKNYDYLVPRKYIVKASKIDVPEVNYIKFKASDTIDIVRAELEYQ